VQQLAFKLSEFMLKLCPASAYMHTMV